MKKQTFSPGMALAAAIAMSAPAGAHAQDQDLAARVQRLEDREAIRTVLERFFEYQENGPQEAYANLFAQDGSLILRMGTTSGGPAGFLRGRGGGQPEGKRPPARMRHILSNINIEVDGDTARATSRFTLIVASEDNTSSRVGGSGRYFDDLVRENGEWKIQKRVIARDIPIPEPGSNPPVD